LFSIANLSKSKLGLLLPPRVWRTAGNFVIFAQQSLEKRSTGL